MTALETAIRAQNPSYLGQALSPRYHRLHASLLVGARELLVIEYESCLRVVRNRKMLRRIHKLDSFTGRMRFLARTLGEDLDEAVLAPVVREEYFRMARHKLRLLRRMRKRNSTEYFSFELRRLKGTMRAGGLSNRDIRTTAKEMREFRRIADALDAIHEERGREAARQRLQRQRQRELQAQ